VHPENFPSHYSGFRFDSDDLELYGDDEDGVQGSMNERNPKASNVGIDMSPSRYNTLGGYISGAGLSDKVKAYLLVCRQSGKLQIFDVSQLSSSAPEINDSDLVWYSPHGAALGIATLASVPFAPPISGPRMHKSLVSEARVFFSGPSPQASKQNEQSDLSILRSLCLLIENNLGDIYLYTGAISHVTNSVEFKRVSLGVISRPSKEESRHSAKLKRKNIVKNNSSGANSDQESFRANRLHRFFSISGQDGLFAATSRPLWFVSERGAPSVLCHRLRHAAPAGGRPLPVTGFCPGLRIYGEETDNFGFLTLHERIGRGGSQRLTMFTGLSDIFTSHGLLPGGGLSVQKVPLGVTVRSIQFLDDVSLSTVSHPIYALLISREKQGDQSHLSDDGRSSLERRLAKEEREKEKIRRQVEADLGGFDVEQEWVEEIERDDCFFVERKYGGAPSIPTLVYELWVRVT